MLTTSCTIKLNKFGSTATRHGVTPAEAALLIAEHHANAGGNPFTLVGDPQDIQRSPMSEVQRLQTIYNVKKVKALYPTATSPLPSTYDEAVEIGMNSAMPVTRLIDHDASN